MKPNYLLISCTLLLMSLLAACMSENIPLSAPATYPVPVSPRATATPAPPAATATPMDCLPAASATAITRVQQARIIDLLGEGRWRTSTNASWGPASIGESLGLENQVLTAAGARAMIDYLAGLRVYVAPKTLFTVKEIRQAEDASALATIRLLLGQVFVSHHGPQTSKIRIETNAGIAGVRGTMISVKVTGSGRVVVTCLEGTCTLENDYGSIILSAGMQAELLRNTAPPVFLGLIANYQFNEWFEYVSSALQTALSGGLLASLPIGCNLANSQSCQILLECNPNTGLGCLLPPICNTVSGAGCELPGGCNLVTGEGCALPGGCNPVTGAGCTLSSGCNPVTLAGCAQPLNCDLLSGRGCLPAAGCDLTTGQGCELASGCNPVTGSGCFCLNNTYTCTGLSTFLPPLIPTGMPAMLPTGLPTGMPPKLLTAIPPSLTTKIPGSIPSAIPRVIPQLPPIEIPSSPPVEVPSGLPW